jgi:hypothetical protein
LRLSGTLSMRSFSGKVGLLFALGSLTACGGAGQSNSPDNVLAPMHGVAVHRNGSLGPVLTTSDRGQIFGFDVDRTGNDGVLASISGNEISVQTFDATTGAITKTLAVKTGRPVAKGDDYLVDGVFNGDVALIDFEKAGIAGQTPAHDLYRPMNPVTRQKLNGKWKPPLKLFHVEQWAVNQSTSTSVLFGYQRKGSDGTSLIVANLTKRTGAKAIALDPNQFSLQDGPQLAQDTVNDLAVMATSPSGGAAGGPPPKIATIDVKNGKLTEFGGASCPGFAGCGSANGIAYDSATGIACTTTELDGGVEFYDVSKQTGFHVSMPNGGGQSFAGSYVVNDPTHQLFLIAQQFSSTSQSGSSVQVYDESGNLVESLNGFNFTDAGFLVIPVRIAVNPATRTGWVNGPSDDQLQEFSY